jgi:GNAT superfamily N-acetyltransferase
MRVSVVPFNREAHLDQTVQVLLRVRAADPSYPPPVDVEATAEAFAGWLLADDVISRWVALSDDRVVGHVALAEAHDYLLDFLGGTEFRELAGEGLCEISKLFVDPDVQRNGAGGALLATALDSAAELDRVAVLAVVAASEAARRLYARSSLTEIGTFDGIHGENHVFIEADGIK